MTRFAKYGASLAAAATILAFAATAGAYVASDFGSVTLKVGSSGTAVSNLQGALNNCSGLSLSTDGKFGQKTRAAVVAFQQSSNLTADGLVGMKTKMALSSCGTVVTVPPSTGTCPAGFTCLPNSGTTTPSSAEGYLADQASDSTNRVSTVYESEMDRVIGGFRVTARLADQKVERVQFTLRNTDTSSSANLAKYISGASLWYGSTKIGSMSVSDASRSNSDDTYTFNFTGLNSVVAKDQIGRFYVSVNVNGSLDSTDTTNSNWTLTFPASSVRATSPNGVYQSYDPSTGGAVSFTGIRFGKFSANGVKAEVSLSTNNPKAGVIAVSNTSATNSQELLRFRIKATNSNLTLRKIPVQVTITSDTSADNVSDILNTLKLMSGSNTVDSVDGSAGYGVSGGAIDTSDTSCVAASDDTCGYLFSNLSSPYNTISAGTTAEFSVVADLKQVTGNYTEGATIVASVANADALLVANFSVQDSNGDQLTAGSTYRTGSGVGEVMTLRVNGVTVVMGTPSYSTTTRGGNGSGASDPVRVTYSIPLTITSFGQTLYMGQIAAYDSDAAGTGTSAEAVAFGFNSAAAPATLISSGALGTNLNFETATISSSDASIESNGYRLDAGSAKHFTLNVTIEGVDTTGPATAGNYRVQLNDARFFTNAALTTGAANQDLVPAQYYRTDYKTAVHD